MPDAAGAVAGLHGPLMVCGFFGVVIALERAVALGRLWAYAAPLLAGLGSVAALYGRGMVAPWLWLAGSGVLLAASLVVLARQREAFMVTIAGGAACWTVGTALWAAGAVALHDALGWWLAFLVLTIAGERLELSRFLPRSAAAQRAFAAIVIALVAALVAWTAVPVWAPRWFGAALLALAAWLARNDLARRTVRQRGLTRFIAVCLLSGYVWLAVGGAVIAVAGLAPGGSAYDAALHALLLGFVFAMVFGHAPVIFPAVLRVAVPYDASFYAPLALLHAAVALRVGGDALGAFDLLRWGGLLSALALLAFIANTARAVLMGQRHRTSTARLRAERR
jgi:hypothetical protein